MRYILFSFFTLISAILSKLSHYFYTISELLYSQKFQRKHVSHSTRYDMKAELNEVFYANQYWEAIGPHIKKNKKISKALDLGCGQGRFSLELAKKFPRGKIIGVDLSSQAISQAKNYARLESLTNIEFINEPIEKALGRFRKNEFDVIFLTEVIFFWPEWKKSLPKIKGLLRPGGLLILSSRSQYFNALCLVKMKNWPSVSDLITKNKGRIFKSPITFTWQTKDQIQSFLELNYKFKIVDQIGIGVCSGIAGDPHATLAEPSSLDDLGKNSLMKLEIFFGRQLPDAGRYILTIARKSI